MRNVQQNYVREKTHVRFKNKIHFVRNVRLSDRTIVVTHKKYW